MYRSWAPSLIWMDVQLARIREDAATPVGLRMVAGRSGLWGFGFSIRMSKKNVWRQEWMISCAEPFRRERRSYT